MASYAKDPRYTAMAEALAPLLRRNCPEGAGGQRAATAAEAAETNGILARLRRT
ncbi:hypothetical protein [Streptomyces sp. NBC_01643]|uniref:hypothetical protein n=1 Tax=Streptomyces sp. NBC_01643 TaxID=2975906 RepID=UPI002F90DD7D|nr:hypothetical protein OHB03_46335 [Streptomyces sp. NBC_01643]WTD39917.1 hypothetical protein OHB03_49815 [Streptomyces sp. NBC_01643]